MQKQIILFNKTILNNFHNFISNKLIICDDKDPPWMTDETKALIKKENWLYQRQRISGNLDDHMLNAITPDILNAVTFSKFKYHDRLTKNLNNIKIAAKTYGFTNGSKIPLILLLSVGN